MKKAEHERHLVVSFNFHPQQGSEEAVGWTFARMSAGCAPTVVYTQASYRVKMAEADQALIPENMEVRYYQPRWLRDWMKGRVLPVAIYYQLWHLGLFLHLRKVTKRERFSLCHVCTWVSAIHPVASLFLPLPKIWGPLGGVAMPPFSFYGSHGGKWKLREFLRLLSIRAASCNPLLRASFGKADLILVAAKDCRDWLIEHEFAERSKVRVLPAITFPQQIIAGVRSQVADAPPSTQGKLCVVTAARLLPWKGVDMLLAAVARCGRADLQLRVFGEGPDKFRLESLADELGVTSQVQFLGQVQRDDLLQEVSQADLFVLPSLHDSEAGACMEAAGLGVPVVALDFGGARSCLEGCRATTFLEGQEREKVIEELARSLTEARSPQDRGNPETGNIPADSLLLYENKNRKMKEWYAEVASSSGREITE